MWGAPAEAPWRASNKITKRRSHKWHLVNEDSLVKRSWDIDRWADSFTLHNVWYGVLNCGETVHPFEREPNALEQKYPTYRRMYTPEGLIDLRQPLILADKLKLSQSNICAICKRAKMKQLDLQNVEI